MGQYLQEAHVQLRQRLAHMPFRVMHWIKHDTVSGLQVAFIPGNSERATCAPVLVAVIAAAQLDLFTERQCQGICAS